MGLIKSTGADGGVGELPDHVRVRFGDYPVPISCNACKKMYRSGLLVAIGTESSVFVCIKCMAQALVKWQDMHPEEDLIEKDVNVPDGAYSRMAKRLQEIVPQISDSDAAKACREVLDEI